MSHFSDEAKEFLNGVMAKLESLLGSCVTETEAMLEPVVEAAVETIEHAAVQAATDAIAHAAESLAEKV